MDSNFTPENIANVTFEINSHSEINCSKKDPGEMEPSDSVIQRLLNYSKALIAVESKLTNRTNLLLLN
ncbi:MAG: hypothetical protein CVT94_08490 [Bacteroidetes bacterium HGW-Bacteroidetes-11]|jgi:hypothetical protein|nr:MAG: hypothetical protein CVT94_08490 [Bacteroidetes bacterium HGW-Bacteroidetes-11]